VADSPIGPGCVNRHRTGSVPITAVTVYDVNEERAHRGGGVTIAHARPSARGWAAVDGKKVIAILDCQISNGQELDADIGL